MSSQEEKDGERKMEYGPYKRQKLADYDEKMVVDSPTVEIEDGEISSSHDQKEVTTKMQGLSTAATLEPSLRSKAYAMIEKQVVEQNNKEAILN